MSDNECPSCGGRMSMVCDGDVIRFVKERDEAKANVQQLTVALEDEKRLNEWLSKKLDNCAAEVRHLENQNKDAMLLIVELLQVVKETSSGWTPAKHKYIIDRAKKILTTQQGQ